MNVKYTTKDGTPALSSGEFMYEESTKTLWVGTGFNYEPSEPGGGGGGGGDGDEPPGPEIPNGTLAVCLLPVLANLEIISYSK